MAITSGFYDSVNGDRKYNSNQISSLFEGIINDGVFVSIGTSLVVTASAGMTVNVGKGRAWFNQTWTNNDAIYPVVVSASEMALNRIDAVVLEVNTNADVRANSIKVIKGVPGSVPVNPVMIHTEYINQYPLCYIYVGAGVAVITQANITNLVGTVSCPFITGLLQTMTIDGITALLESEFNIWFENIQAQLEGDVAGNLQNQIDAINDYNASKTEIYSYLAFCANTSATSLDAAFGKLNESFVGALGKQLAMYSWFKTDSKVTYPFTNLLTRNTLMDCLGGAALFDVMNNANIKALINASTYAKNIYDNLDISSAICYTTGLSAITYPTMAAIVGSEVAMTTIINSASAMSLITQHPKTMTTVAASATAMGVITASSTIMTTVAADSTFMGIIASSDTAMNKIVESGIALKAICLNLNATAAVKVSIQSRRATVVTTLNLAVVAGLFTLQAAKSYSGVKTGTTLVDGSYVYCRDCDLYTNTIVIPTSSPDNYLTSESFGAARYASYGASSLYIPIDPDLIWRYDAYIDVNDVVAINQGVSMRGIRCMNTHPSIDSRPSIICDVYTVV